MSEAGRSDKGPAKCIMRGNLRAGGWPGSQGAPKWTKDHPNGPRTTQMDQGPPKWIPGAPKWTKDHPNGPRTTQMDQGPPKWIPGALGGGAQIPLHDALCWINTGLPHSTIFKPLALSLRCPSLTLMLKKAFNSIWPWGAPPGLATPPQPQREPKGLKELHGATPVNSLGRLGAPWGGDGGNLI